jgi:hypothetical protein
MSLCITRWSAFSLKHLFIETAFHLMACSSNAQFHLVFKTVSTILMKSRFDEKAL